MRQCGRVGQIGVFERDERQHVQHADPGVRAAVPPQVDAFECDAGQCDSRIEHLRRVADDGQHAAVMDDVAAAVEKPRAGGFDRGARRIDNRGIAAFR